MRTLFICSLNWELRRERGVYDTPVHAYTNILYTPLDNTHLHSIPSVTDCPIYRRVPINSLPILYPYEIRDALY